VRNLLSTMANFESGNEKTHSWRVIIDRSTIMSVVPYEEFIDDMTDKILTIFHPQFCSLTPGLFPT
jgi:hypothetical protein